MMIRYDENDNISPPTRLADDIPFNMDELVQRITSSNKGIKEIAITKILSMPFNILKMTKYYYSIQLGYDVLDNKFISNKNNNKTISGFSYINHLAINRKYKKAYNHILMASRYGIYNFGIDTKDKFLTNILINPGKPTEFFVDKLTICRLSFSNTSISLKSNSVSPSLKVEFIGINAYDYYNTLYRIVTKNKQSINMNKFNNHVYINKLVTDVDGSITRNNKQIILSNFNNIVCEDGIIDRIKSELSGFVHSGFIYNKYGLNSTLGIIFHGVPGTGKTSFIKAILNYMIFENKDIKSMTAYNYFYSIDVSTSSNTISKEIDRINSDIDNDYIPPDNDKIVFIYIIIEEIDSIMNTTRDNNQGEINSKIKTLLEFLDGINTPTNCFTIFLASTNYYDKLDKALIRDRRFDLDIELKPFKTQEVIKMCKVYDVDPDDIYSNKEYMDPDYIIIPATLQTKILRYLTKDL